MAIDWDEVVNGPLMSEDIFGEPVTYTPPTGGAAQSVAGVFDRGFVGPVMGETGIEVATREPVVSIRRALLTGDPAKGGVVYVPSVPETYLVTDVQPDGKGSVKLLLAIKKP
jgi:hypothetical protein